MNRSTLTLTSGLCAVALLCSVVRAAPLTGSGSHLPIPPNGAPNADSRTVTGNTTTGPWQGSWVSPVLAAWIGTFDVVGPVPAGNTNPAGSSRYDFTSMPNGELPVGTYFRLGDVDQGSGQTEIIKLLAGNSSGTITTPWLDEAMNISGVGTGTGSTIQATDMPGWNYANGSYEFDGSTIPIGQNPSLGFAFRNNIGIERLTVQRTSQYANFSLLAPVPEPSAAVTIAVLGSLAMLKRIRRFKTR